MARNGKSPALPVRSAKATKPARKARSPRWHRPHPRAPEKAVRDTALPCDPKDRRQMRLPLGDLPQARRHDPA